MKYVWPDPGLWIGVKLKLYEIIMFEIKKTVFKIQAKIIHTLYWNKEMEEKVKNILVERVIFNISQ